MGKWLLGLLGGAGVIASIKSIWDFPKSSSDIITVRNRQNRYRWRTILIGYLTIAVLLISAAAYIVSEYYLRKFGKVCEIDVPTPQAANVLFPFFGVSLVAIVFFAWLQVRVSKCKKPSGR
jgi:hypothetical protein